MEKKKGIIITGIILLLLLVVGVTYAFFIYESGTKSDIVTGQIYMNYEETSTISLTGVFPETKEQALARQDENGVFEFTITGRNTSKYPVYYEIDLLEGGVMTGKTEQSTRLLPEHVRIYLERDGEPLVDGMTFKDWNNRRIYVDTVPANQTNNIEHKYTLRMWIDENVTISDTDPDADYTTTEWNDAYTSLKVRVVGDFEEKEVATDASCFAYNVIVPDGYVAYDYPIITLDTSEEKVEACMANMMDMVGSDMSTEQDGYRSFCEGTGTAGANGLVITIRDYTMNMLGFGGPLENIKSGLTTIDNITYETKYYNFNTDIESINTCKDFMLNYISNGTDRSDALDGYQSFCEGTGTVNSGLTIYDIFTSEDNNVYTVYAPYGLVERNVFTQVEEIPQVIEITNYDEETCGTDVIIPSTIEGLPVTRIADEQSGTPATQISAIGNNLKNNTLYNKNTNYGVKPMASAISGVFSYKGITSVKFPSSLEYIGNVAFNNDNLIEVIIPDSVTVIGENAFSYNDITSIEIGNRIKNIGFSSFYGNPLVTVNIKNNPSLGSNSFYAHYPSDFVSPIGTVAVTHFKVFQYNGTCAELNQYTDVFAGMYAMPQQIITSDTNSCTYTGPVTEN